MEEKIKKLEEKLEKVKLGGGKERIEKQHKAGKMTARERIEYLMDEGTFVEIDEFASSRSTDFGMDKKRMPGDGVVTGWGKINGRITYIYSQDFTVLGGSLGEMHAKKINKVQDLALKNGAPIIGINDSGGARIQEGIDSLYGYGEIFYRNSRASGVIPQISVIMGPCAGGAVYSPAITDFVFMTQNTSQMFITGPQVIKAVLNIDIDKESLGGAIAHSTKSGVAHFTGSTDQETLDMVKLLLSYMPQNNSELPDELEGDYDIGPVPEANNIIDPNPKRAYDVKDFINTVIDKDTFFEVQRNFAPSIVIGFGRVAGQVVGIVANQPKVMAGVLNINSSDKAARFVRFLDSFNIPILTFVDTPGFLPGVDQEHGGIIRHGAKLLYAYSESTVHYLPKI
jgi:acetyl-CoA carboxylase carboxyltransferase component